MNSLTDLATASFTPTSIAMICKGTVSNVRFLLSFNSCVLDPVQDANLDTACLVDETLKAKDGVPIVLFKLELDSTTHHCAWVEGQVGQASIAAPERLPTKNGKETKSC